MKYTFIFLLMFLFVDVKSQSFYHPISNETYDSLMNAQYRGRVYFKNNEFLDGWIHKEPNNYFLMYKENIEDDYINYSAQKVDGFYMVNSKYDTAIFVYLPICVEESTRKEYRPLRILIQDPDVEERGISLLRFAWIEESHSTLKNHEYNIVWDYYIWKDHQLTRIGINKKRFKDKLRDYPSAFEYYKENKKDFDSDHEFSFLQNLIKIYNSQY